MHRCRIGSPDRSEYWSSAAAAASRLMRALQDQFVMDRRATGPPDTLRENRSITTAR